MFWFYMLAGLAGPDPVVRATQLKQLLVNPVNEFSALVRHQNFRHSVSGDQVVQEIRHT